MILREIRIIPHPEMYKGLWLAEVSGVLEEDGDRHFLMVQMMPELVATTDPDDVRLTCLEALEHAIRAGQSLAVPS